MTNNQEMLKAAALRKLQMLKRQECFDPYDLDSRPTEKQLEIMRGIGKYLIRGVVAANRTGKSLMGGREVSWLFQNQFIHFKKPEEWGSEPLLLVVVGRTHELVETEIWEKKIKPFLDPSEYREIRTGSVLQRVKNKKNNNIIIFMSHHNATEAAEKLQGFTAYYVWVDEQPKNASIISELIVRTQAKKGRLLITFTPLVQNLKIKKIIEGLAPPTGMQYNLKQLDNPIFKGREAEILAQYKDLSPEERAARLEGTWFMGESAVYDFSQDNILTPTDYCPHTWEHIEAIDPAASSKLGFILLANKPGTDLWFVAKAKYIPGAAATDLLDRLEIERQGYKIVSFVSDHAPWFLKEASKRGLYYHLANKRDRKLELIKQVQSRLTHKSLYVFVTEVELLDELTTCKWNESENDSIVGASRFHLLDSLQYGVDIIPNYEAPPKPYSDDYVINEMWKFKVAHQERKEKERAKLKKRSKVWGNIWR